MPKSLAPLTARTLRRWSPIPLSEQQRVESFLTTLETKGLQKPDDRQKIATVLRGPLLRVERAALAGYIQCGRWLLRVKARVPYGAFTSLFRGSDNAVEEPLPLTVKKAQALMRVAEHPVLSDPKYFDKLPLSSWRTLDELTKLEANALVRHLATGEVHPAIRRPEVLALRPLRPRRAALPVDVDDEDDERPEDLHAWATEHLDRLVLQAERLGLSLADLAGLLRRRANELEAGRDA